MMNAQGQISGQSIISAFNKAGAGNLANQFINQNLASTGTYPANTVISSLRSSGLNQNQLNNIINGIQQILKSGNTNVNKPNWWANNQSQFQSQSQSPNNQNLGVTGWTNSLSNDTGNSAINTNSNGGSGGYNNNSIINTNGNGGKSGNGWVVVMDTDTFLQLAQSEAMNVEVPQ